MNRDREQIIVIAQRETGREVSRILTGLGRHVSTATSWSQGAEWIEAKQPFMVFADRDMANIETGVQTLKKRHRELQVVVMALPDQMDSTLEKFQGLADDFLALPAPDFAIKIILGRGEEKARLCRELIEARENTGAMALKRVAQGEETARFVTVKQIVDKLSTFIGKIAASAQGGMKFFDEMPYFVSIHDRGARVIAANRTHQKHFGNQVGANSWEIYRGKYAGPATCPVSKTIATGNVQTFRAAVEYQSGTRVPMIVHTAPIFDNEGEIVLVLEVAAGSREIRKTAEEIRRTHQRYQKLFDHAPSFIAVLDRRLRITAVNRQFRKNFGEHIGEPFSQVLKHQCVPDFGCPIRQTLIDGGSHHSEMVLTAADGRQLSTLIWTAPILSATQKLTHVIVIIADISEKRQLQDNLASLGLMIGSISHGLKGTLTGFNAGLYLIETGFYRNQPARIEEGLDVSKLMADHVRKMVSDILYYSKERELEWQLVDAVRFASDIAATVETRIRAANIEFSCRFDPAPGSLEMDAGLIRSALVNILENAMEACIADEEEKAYRITFSVTGESDDIVFDIHDNGTGMDPEEKKNMFTLFYSSKGNRGTGLGLYITDKVIKKHGGHIEVGSQPGKGSRFTIRLPRTPSAAVKSGGRI